MCEKIVAVIVLGIVAASFFLLGCSFGAKKVLELQHKQEERTEKIVYRYCV